MRSVMFPLLSIVSVFVTASFVGFDFVTTDDEDKAWIMLWEPFLKTEPTLQMVFTNPAMKDLELAPLGELSDADRSMFARYCKIRWHRQDPSICHRDMKDRRIPI